MLYLDFYGKTRKRSTILRNNRNYLLDNIQLNNNLTALLLSFNCLAEKQRRFFQRQTSNRNKNNELLCAMRTFDENSFSNFVKCLRQTNQMNAARIMENGGG